MDRRYFLGGLVAGTPGPGAAASAPPVPQRFTALPAKRGVAALPERGPEDPRGESRPVLRRPAAGQDGAAQLHVHDLRRQVSISTATLVGVQRLLGPRVGRDIFLYSISLDPAHDTPRVLSAYARQFKVKPGWLFLTGGAEAVEALRKSLGFVDPDPVVDQDKSQHIGMVKYGIERLERWAACPIFVKPETIVRNLLRIEPKRA